MLCPSHTLEIGFGGLPSVHQSHVLVLDLPLLYKVCRGRLTGFMGIPALRPGPPTEAPTPFQWKSREGHARLHSPNESCFWNQPNSCLIPSLSEVTFLNGSQQPQILILSISESISVISKYLPIITVSQILHLTNTNNLWEWLSLFLYKIKDRNIYRVFWTIL